ncbi:hypothetical protein ACFQ3Z_42110 [Streptomyces nogalater]
MIACGPKCDTAQVDAVRASMGLDQPLLSQFLDYVGGLVTGRIIADVDGTPIPCPAPASATPTPSTSPCSPPSPTACR